MNAMIWTSMPNWLWKPGATIWVPWAVAATYGIPRILTNMKPPTITSEMPIVPMAHAQRDIKNGRITLATKANMSREVAVVKMRA